VYGCIPVILERKSESTENRLDYALLGVSLNRLGTFIG
jgi:hypothetical protein